MGQSQEPIKSYGLPQMAFEWSAKRNSRTGQIENEIITVRGMTTRFFFANVAEVREWIESLPTYGRQAATVSEQLASAEPPAHCPECNGTEFYDNRGDETPNWRCKNKKCGHKVLVVPEGQETLPGVSNE